MRDVRLLLAEDEEELSHALVAILRHAGYEVAASPDGEDALYQLRRGDFDLVILDIMMPKVDGLAVLRELRTAGNDVPVLILTARSGVDDRVCGLDAGANDYLGKPFSAKELLARIRALTRTSPGAVRPRPSFGDMWLDEAAHAVACGAGSVDLTATEYRLMQLLVEHGSDRTTVDQIMRRVWGDLADVEQGVVWVNVSNLRKKLRLVGSRVTISSLRGVGYRLEMPAPPDLPPSDEPASDRPTSGVPDVGPAGRGADRG